MTTAFNPATAYRGDIGLRDFAERADYLPPIGSPASLEVFGVDVVRLDANDPDIEVFAVGLGLQPTDSVILASMPLDGDGKVQAFEPKQGGRLELKTSQQTWVIAGCRQNRFGHWEIGVTEAVENAGA